MMLIDKRGGQLRKGGAVVSQVNSGPDIFPECRDRFCGGLEGWVTFVPVPRPHNCSGLEGRRTAHPRCGGPSRKDVSENSRHRSKPVPPEEAFKRGRYPVTAALVVVRRFVTLANFQKPDSDF